LSKIKIGEALSTVGHRCGLGPHHQNIGRNLLDDGNEGMIQADAVSNGLLHVTDTSVSNPVCASIESISLSINVGDIASV